MKQSKAVKQSGPFYITSHSQGSGKVYFIIYPAFPQYDRSDFAWAESRYKLEGGGPSIFTSIAVSKALAEFLNSVYSVEKVSSWEKRIKDILDDESKAWEFVECNDCGTLSSVTKEWHYCPICGNPFKREKSPIKVVK